MFCFWKLFYMCLFLKVILSKGSLRATGLLPSPQTKRSSPSAPTANTTMQESKNNTKKPDASCWYAPGKKVGNRNRELKCCAFVKKVFERDWAVKNKPLSRYLETLKIWNCPELKEECHRRLFAFNPFTDLLYDYFCDYARYVTQCLPDVKSIVTRTVENREKTISSIDSGNASFKTLHWNESIKIINVSQLAIDQLLRPCIQVLQFELEEIHNGDFQEMSTLEIPTCKLTWCGFSGNSLTERTISLWTCMTTSCRAKVITIIVVCGLLGLAITIFNAIVILTLMLNTPLQNSQATYKISLAVADLLVGVIVLPTCISTLSKLVWTQHVQEGFYNVRGYTLEEDNSLSENLKDFSVRKKSGQFLAIYSQHYLNAVGFFTAVSVFVSVYTLAGAGFDRLSAVCRPLSYRKERAGTIAKWVCALAWFLAVIFGILPFFVPDLSYGLILGVLVTNIDRYGIYLYIVAFVFPLLIVWIVNIASYVATKKHSKFRKRLTNTTQTKSQTLENRLAKTLGFMVGVFTFNTLPLIILLICSLFVPSITYSRPRELSLKVALDYNTVEFVAVLLLFSNSFWNFFIYSIRNRDFRNAMKGMFSKTSRKIALLLRANKGGCGSRMPGADGRRRLSSTPNISAYTKRKKSSVATILTRFTSESPIYVNNLEMTTNVLGSSLPDVTADLALDPQQRQRRTCSLDATSIDPEVTSIEGDDEHYSVENEKRNNEELAPEDSIFQSYAIDAHSDRLFMSVMENINPDKDINEANVK